MFNKIALIVLLCSFAGVLMIGCGGGIGGTDPAASPGTGGSGTPGGSTTPPDPSALGVTLTSLVSRQFRLDWNVIPSADHYRVSEAPSGTTTSVMAGGANVTTNTFTFSVVTHMTDWNNHQFFIDANDGGGSSIVASTAVNIVQSNSLVMTGYRKASNVEAGDQFGAAVALSGDGSTMVVASVAEDSATTGINGVETDNGAADSGAVYVFVRSGSAFVQQAYIKASNAQAGDNFGCSVALSSDGNTLVVGADREDSNATGMNGTEDDNSSSNSGAVYVFTRAGTTWTQEAYIKAFNTGDDDAFGSVVDVSANGNTLAVGADWEKSNDTGINQTGVDDSMGGAGAVYVFTRAGTTWTQEAYIKASNTQASDQFGEFLTVAADGNTLAVSARWEASEATGIDGNQAGSGAPGAGAVYVFTRAGTTWSQQAYVKASNTGGGDQFGRGVALSADGDTLAVGATSEASTATGIGGDQTDNSAVSVGAVYVFTRAGTVWTQEEYIKASNAGVGDHFGNAISLSTDGNVMAVGAYLEDGGATGVGGVSSDNSADSAGAGYVFTRTGTTWTEKNYIKATNTQSLDLFGVSIAISDDGNVLIIGADDEDSNSVTSPGDNSAASAGAVYDYL